MVGLIILGIFVLLIAIILAIRVTIIVHYKNNMVTSTFKIFTFEKEFDIVKILKVILFPDKSLQDAKKEKEKKEKPPKEVKKDEPKKEGPEKYLKQIYINDGLAGIFELISNIFQTLSTAVLTFFRHFIINHLHVNIVVVGSDSCETALAYGRICQHYQPFIGFVRNGMTVKDYQEEIYPDFLAVEGKEDVYFEASISIYHLLGIVFATAKTFLVNILRTNKENKKIKNKQVVQK